MSPAEEAAAHDRNFVAALGVMATSAAAGSTATFGAIPVAITGVPGSFFNAAWVLEPPDPGSLRDALAHLRASGLPFTLHVRDDLGSLIDEAPRLGLTDEGRLPCFAMEPGPVPPAPSGVSFEQVDAQRWDAFADATAEGFGLPRALVDDLYAPSMLDDPRLRAYVGLSDGEAVATGVSILTDRTLGLYSIATVPRARGRGIGTATTWAMLADQGAWDVAVLQASEMGRPVYERMGFRLVREFAELVGLPAAELPEGPA
jgi:hypothetical protein